MKIGLKRDISFFKLISSFFLVFFFTFELIFEQMSFYETRSLCFFGFFFLVLRLILGSPEVLLLPNVEETTCFS